ncbi:MAG: hypothetical protein K2P17_05190 [Helicobacteraceae bacterium]|nr:hypothetical protein [Helicobacteraceae bacterium]
MNSKQRELLNEMIAIYIKDREPIGSESLRLTMDMKISSATIRNYFKVLVEEGILFQPHISSGRIPTNNTLKNYWRSNLDINNVLVIDNIDKVKSASKKNGIFCNIKILNNEILKEIINFNNKYIILIFENSEAILPFSEHIYSFIKEFLYKNIEDIKMIAKSVCVNSLFYKLENIIDTEIFNFGYEFLNLIDSQMLLEIINSHIYYRLKNGFYFDLFPDGYLALIQDVRLENNYGKMFVFGELCCNYKDFYNEIAS